MLFLFGKNPGKKVPVSDHLWSVQFPGDETDHRTGFSPFLILATDSLILIIMNAVLQKYGGAEQGDMFITCATIAQSYLLLITSPMIGISGGTQAILSYNYGAKDIRQGKIRREKYPGRNADFYHPYVLSLQNRPAVLCPAVHYRPDLYELLCMGHPYLYFDDHSFKFSVCFRRRTYCSGASEDRTCIIGIS